MQSKDPDVRQRIAGRLRQAREMAGLSQAQVSKMLGLHRPSVSEIEAGRRRVAADELAKLADLYSVNVAWLTSEDEADQTTVPDDLRLAARELAGLDAKDLDDLLKVVQMLKRRRGD